jgi:hypothetical protein
MTVTLPPIYSHTNTVHPSVVSSVYSTTSIIPGTGRPGVDVIPEDEQPHDHRDFDANPVPGAEYAAFGGGASTASFSSVPGIAVPGVASPGSP